MFDHAFTEKLGFSPFKSVQVGIFRQTDMFEFPSTWVRKSWFTLHEPFSVVASVLFVKGEFQRQFA